LAKSWHKTLVLGLACRIIYYSIDYCEVLRTKFVAFSESLEIGIRVGVRVRVGVGAGVGVWACNSESTRDVAE